MAQSVTRRAALKTFGVGLTGMALAKFGLNQAQAITNGDLDGEGHPNVGGFVLLKSLWPPLPPPLFVGSASLIHPQVVLTAGHASHTIEDAIASGIMNMDDLLLSFASDATQGTWNAISAVITHPDFDPRGPVLDGAGNIPLADVGVAILKEPVTRLPLMPLPPPGFLDDLESASRLRHGSDRAQFTVVGYGVDYGPNPGHWPFPPDGKRRVAESAFRKLHDRWLFLDQSLAHDLGGTGAGDSGGPTFWVDPLTGEPTLVALTSRGSNFLEVQYRVDTAEALSFINYVLEGV